MNDLSNIDKIAARKKVTDLSTKPQVSLDKMEKNEGVAAVEGLKTYEIEMEQADHAFALMTEIRQKLEKAYNELSSSE